MKKQINLSFSEMQPTFDRRSELQIVFETAKGQGLKFQPLLITAGNFSLGEVSGRKFALG